MQRSVVSTRRAVSCQSTSGTLNSGSLAKFSVTPRLLRLRTAGPFQVRPFQRAFRWMQWASDGVVAAVCVRRFLQSTQQIYVTLKGVFDAGRRILTATLRPSWVTAKCTCAMDAAAMAWSSNRRIIRLRAPSSSSMVARLSAANGGRLVLQLEDRSVHSLRPKGLSGLKGLAEFDETWAGFGQRARKALAGVLLVSGLRQCQPF